MVSKNQKKLIKSLNQKKNRKALGLFIAEGIKVVNELLDADLELHSLFALKVSLFNVRSELIHQITVDELKQISLLTTPQSVLAIFRIPESKVFNSDGLTVVLDDVRDPGNLGTIIRLCDWFGISDLICSEQTVDCYNPKVIQATMGSITRVNIRYENLYEFLCREKGSQHIFGAFMDGNQVYAESLPEKGIVIMGNEANGVSEEIEKLVDKKISIPQFGLSKKTESLNVATATAIILSEFRRNFIEK